MLRQCINAIAERDPNMGDALEETSIKSLRFGSQAKWQRKHPFFQQGEGIEAVLRPLEEAEAKARGDRNALEGDVLEDVGVAYRQTEHTLLVTVDAVPEIAEALYGQFQEMEGRERAGVVGKATGVVAFEVGLTVATSGTSAAGKLATAEKLGDLGKSGEAIGDAKTGEALDDVAYQAGGDIVGSEVAADVENTHPQSSLEQSVFGSGWSNRYGLQLEPYLPRHVGESDAQWVRRVLGEINRRISEPHIEPYLKRADLMSSFFTAYIRCPSCGLTGPTFDLARSSDVPPSRQLPTSEEEPPHFGVVVVPDVDDLAETAERLSTPTRVVATCRWGDFLENTQIRLHNPLRCPRCSAEVTEASPGRAPEPIELVASLEDLVSRTRGRGEVPHFELPGARVRCLRVDEDGRLGNHWGIFSRGEGPAIMEIVRSLIQQLEQSGSRCENLSMYKKRAEFYEWVE